MFVNRCSRKILKLKWTDKIRNEQLWERTGQVPIQTEIGRRRWKWVGHTLRKGKNSITRQALQWNPQGSRGRGRPRETWRRCMEREMKDVGMTWVALSKKAQDRDVWRMFVAYTLTGVRGNDRAETFRRHKVRYQNEHRYSKINVYINYGSCAWLSLCFLNETKIVPFGKNCYLHQA